MLQSIRDRAQGLLAWVIVALIIIPFALWGINQYFGGGEEKGVATVNATKIYEREVQNEYLQQQQRLQQMFGENFRPELFPEEAMKGRILQQLIERELLLQASADAGLRVDNSMLGATIRSIPAFQQDGKFSKTLYEQYLRRQGLSPKGFEEKLRRDLVAQQLYSGLTQTEFATSSEIESYLAVKNQTRNIGYVVVPVSAFEQDIEVSEQDATEYYDANKDRFMVPEQVSIAYLEVNAQDIAAGIEVSDEELKARYEAQKANYEQAEQRRARHILIRVAEDAAPKEVETAKAKAEKLLEELREGASFKELAKANSEDPGSAKEGGDLGFFSRGQMVPAFDQAAFSLKVGELSEPVRSSFGYHIIKLEEIKEKRLKSFEEVQGQLLAEIRGEKAKDIVYDQAERLAELTHTNPDSLDFAAEELELKIAESELFSRKGGKGITANRKVIDAAFSEDVLARGYNSEAIELGPNHYVVLRVREHKMPAPRPFEEVKDEIKSLLTKEKARSVAEEAAKALFERIQQGEGPAKVAEEKGWEWKTQDNIQRTATTPDRAIVQQAFEMPRPESSEKPVFDRTTLNSGDQAVLALYGVTDGKTEDLSEEQAKTAASTLKSANAQAGFKAFIDGLRAKADITIRGNE